MLAAIEPDDRALWATALYGGVRRGELRALRWADVDLAGGVIHVRRDWDAREGEIEPKSRRGKRRVPIPAVLRDAGVKAQSKAGLDPLQVHDCRHSYASMMIAAGVNAKALSSYLGHSSITLTFDRYGHMLPGSDDEAADLFDAYLARSAGDGLHRDCTAPPANPLPERAAA